MENIQIFKAAADGTQLTQAEAGSIFWALAILMIIAACGIMYAYDKFYETAGIYSGKESIEPGTGMKYIWSEILKSALILLFWTSILDVLRNSEINAVLARWGEEVFSTYIPAGLNDAGPVTPMALIVCIAALFILRSAYTILVCLLLPHLSYFHSEARRKIQEKQDAQAETGVSEDRTKEEAL